MLGYDIDGTLADVSFANIYNKKQLVARYENAPVLYTPKAKFIAITARGKDLDVKQATRTWLVENQPNCEGVFFVDGSEEEKIKGKAQYVKDLKLDGYVDSSVKTLSLFEKFGVTGIKLYHLTNNEVKLWKEL